MSFVAKMSIDEEEMNVLHCNFRFSQMVDSMGKVSSRPYGGKVNVTVESTGNNLLFDWMIGHTQIKSGKITFFRRDTSSKLKTLEFIDAFCIDYFEEYDHQGDNPMQIQLCLSAKEIRLNNSFYANDWPE